MYEPERHPAAQGPHLGALLALQVGQQYVIPGTTASKARNLMRNARRGSRKKFAARTLTTGACIRRLA